MVRDATADQGLRPCCDPPVFLAALMSPPLSCRPTTLHMQMPIELGIIIKTSHASHEPSGTSGVCKKGMGSGATGKGLIAQRPRDRDQATHAARECRRWREWPPREDRTCRCASPPPPTTTTPEHMGAAQRLRCVEVAVRSWTPLVTRRRLAEGAGYRELHESAKLAVALAERAL